MIRKIILFAALIFSLGSCTKDFKTINIDPNNSTKVPLGYLLTQTQLYIGGSAGDPGYATWRANLMYALPATQMTAAIGTYYGGDKYIYEADLSEAYFVTQYPNAIKGLVDLINQAKADPANINILSIARIEKALQMSMITDLYGDVPYSEAGQTLALSSYGVGYISIKSNFTSSGLDFRVVVIKGTTLTGFSASHPGVNINNYNQVASALHLSN